MATWSIRDGESIAPDEPIFFNQATWFTNGVAIDHSGKTVATAESRRDDSPRVAPMIVIRDGASGDAVAELGETAASAQTRLAFAPDGRALYAWDNRLLERWDLTSGSLSKQLEAPGRAYFQGLAVHPAGRILITVAGDGQARYWDPVDLSPRTAFNLKVGKLHAVAISPDGMMAAAGADKGKVVIWDVDV
jgi:WD40 repeat protein